MKYILFLILGLSGSTVHAWEVGLGIYKPDYKVQDSSGDEKSDLYAPYLQVGWHIPVSARWFPDFLPRIGYIIQKNNSEDRYASGYKIETLTLLYDFMYKPSGFRYGHFRYGIGSFLQKITGEGGTVTVPNGAGTSTAYRPSGSSQSALMTFNAGVDIKYNARLGSFLRDLGTSFELFYFDPGGKASYLAFQLGVIGYF